MFKNIDQVKGPGRKSRNRDCKQSCRGGTCSQQSCRTRFCTPPPHKVELWIGLRLMYRINLLRKTFVAIVPQTRKIPTNSQYLFNERRTTTVHCAKTQSRTRRIGFRRERSRTAGYRRRAVIIIILWAVYRNNIDNTVNKYASQRRARRRRIQIILIVNNNTRTRLSDGKKRKNVEHEVHAYKNIIRYNITSNNIVFVQRTRRFRIGARYARCDDIVLRRVTLFFFLLRSYTTFHTVYSSAR